MYLELSATSAQCPCCKDSLCQERQLIGFMWHRMQLTGVGLDPFVVEKQTLLMLLLSELFQQKGMPVASTNVTSVNVISSAFQSAGRRSNTGRYCICIGVYVMLSLSCLSEVDQGELLI